MKVQQTSLMAYRDPVLQSGRKSIRDLVFSYVTTHPDCTQAEFCDRFGLKAHCVSGRFRELEESMYIVKSGKKNEDLCQGRLVSTYRLNIAPFTEVGN